MRRFVGVLAGLLAACSLGGSAAEAATYHLDKVADMNRSTAPDVRSGVGINAGGSVASSRYPSLDSGLLESFVLSSDVLVQIPKLSTGVSQTAGDVNDSGQVVGTSGGTFPRGYTWTAGGGTLALQSVTATVSLTDSIANAINDATPARIVGSGRLAGTEGNRHIVTWDAATRAVTDLGVPLTGAIYSYATDINDVGTIVGYSLISGIEYAFVIPPGSTTAATLFVPPGATSCRPLAINDVGWVVGDCFFPGTVETQATKAVLWDARLAPTIPAPWILPILAGDWTFSNDINDQGQIVGQAFNQSPAGNINRAVLWEVTFGATGLPTSIAGPTDLLTTLDAQTGWTLECASAINASGQIAGWGRGTSGYYELFRLTPVAPKTAVIAVDPTSLSFTASAYQNSPAQNVAISNTGTGSMNWTVASGASWLKASPTSGSGLGTISVYANTSGLSASTYASNLTIASAEASISPVTLPVTLTVTQPTIVLSPANLAFSAVEGGVNPGSEPIAVSNAGEGTMNWYASTLQTWLSISPTSGAGNGTVMVTANVSGLAAGTYSGSVRISALGATNTPQTAPVTLTVAPKVAVLTPAAGETLSKGIEYLVSWAVNASFPTLTAIDLYYTTSATATKVKWLPIATDVSPSTTSQRWTPTTASDKCQIKIVLKEGTGRKVKQLAQGLSGIFSIR